MKILLAYDVMISGTWSLTFKDEFPTE